ncbi:MAG: acetyl-CoA carboxylase biotin carboxylase subunit [Gammaproteobacteria bacterium]|nr:acetyl-CoA carboxylase biotin carboxylase subunit [Gammaproteobacteria bacterium]
MFEKILIANRGEIACRIIKTARRLGIKTVAIYSAADANALHVRAADEAIAIGPAPSSQSYLAGDKILAAAAATGAQAIHPGYGFLSENSEFAEACAKAGVVFIGPGVDAIRIMGSKSEAKALMSGHAVPLVPGYYGSDQSTAGLTSAAHEVGLPLLIKATAGGGGRGMRVVRDFAEFAAALASAQREALSAVGDSAVLLERYIENPRHIEVQVFGDTQGNIVHLFERDCSLQRRHQKMVEEAPAILLSDDQRKQLFNAALQAARAVNYVGAGTVEFIIDKAGAVYFIEMNTRLQVEHPVTERITGLDLVEWQLRVASGETLPLRQSDIRCEGHAVEVRVYAEDPAHDFLPGIGQLVHLRLPHETESVRVDSGVVSGDSVTPYYDAMIAKVITDGANRAEALQRMRHALAATEIVGVATNIDYLQNILAHEGYLAGGCDTHFVEDACGELLPRETPVPFEAWVLLAFHALTEIAARAQLSAAPESPWAKLIGFRLNTSLSFEFSWKYQNAVTSVEIHQVAAGWEARSGNARLFVSAFEVVGGVLQLASTESRLTGTIVTTAREQHLFYAGTHTRVQPFDPLHSGEDLEEAVDKLVAPMPGAITAVLVKVGDKVSRGTPLLVLEAMKIEHTINAPFDGIVSEIRLSVGEQVLAEGVELIKLEAALESNENQANG